MAESPGFTGLGAPTLPGFPVLPLPGQCIHSQPWLRALTHRVAPLMCGRPGAGATGPVLLACRQWDPLGLAQRLPCPGVGAWRSAPLLAWRVQCPVRVCAALTAGSGGSGRYLVLCVSRFLFPAPRVPRCVWRAVRSRCPLPSLAGTPFQAVCAFGELGPVDLLVFSACPLRVCALALPRRPLPPPLGGVACAARAVQAVCDGRAVPHGPCPSARPALVPCSVWRAPGGPVQSWFLPTLPGLHALWGLRAAGVVGSRPRGGGVACHRCEGRLVSGALPPPAARPLWRAGGVPRPVCPGCGRCGCGVPAPAPQRAPLRAGVARSGGGGRVSLG